MIMFFIVIMLLGVIMMALDFLAWGREGYPKGYPWAVAQWGIVVLCISFVGMVWVGVT